MAKKDIKIIKDVKVGTLPSGRKIIIPKEREFAPSVFESMAKVIVSPEIKAQMIERAKRRGKK